MTKVIYSFLFIFVVACSVQAQSGFGGNWNWAIFAKDKSELPPAYQEMDLKEVPGYALDLTLKRRGNRLTGSFGLVARYLARVDEGDFSGPITGNTVVVKLKSNFGGSAVVRLTLNGNTIKWKVLRATGNNYFPNDVSLRRLKPGEKPPYVADEDEP